MRTILIIACGIVALLGLSYGRDSTKPNCPRQEAAVYTGDGWHCLLGSR